MLNIALTFSLEDERRLGKVAQALNEKVGSVYITSQNSRAHLSLTHIEGYEVEADTMWKRLLDSGLKMEYEVVLKTFVVDSPWKGRVYTSFTIEEWGKLQKIQTNIMRIFNDRKVFNGYGADFEPHVTTSCHLDVLKRDKIPAQKLPFKKLKAYLTLGTRDSYGRMERILYGGYKG